MDAIGIAVHRSGVIRIKPSDYLFMAHDEIQPISQIEVEESKDEWGRIFIPGYILVEAGMVDTEWGRIPLPLLAGINHILYSGGSYTLPLNDLLVEASYKIRTYRRDINNLPHREQQDAVVAWKYAKITPHRHRDKWLFEGIGRDYPYGPEEMFTCLCAGSYRDPHVEITWDTNCGFYAYKTPDPHRTMTAPARLKVELMGKVLQFTDGYRAEYQRVLEVDFERVCHFHTGRTMCPTPAIGLAMGREMSGGFLPACTFAKGHWGIKDVIPLAEASGMLGTEIKWRED